MAPRFFPVVFKQLWRHRVRSVLTLSGVAIAMFLFITVQTLQEGVRSATQRAASDATLVVYRANRFCPATSRLPQFYVDRIERVPGVTSATPLKVVVNNCRASLDVVTFRGIPREALEGGGGDIASSWRFVAGSAAEWLRRSDAALVGERLASRRGFKVGDSFDSSGVTVTVAGIIRSDEPQDQNVAYVHLDFLQQAGESGGKGGGLGVVTQFTVRVDDPAKLEAVAAAIDEQFASEADPTTTRPEKAFVAHAGADIVELVTFTRWLGWGSVAAVLALIANAMALGVQDRVREHAVLQTLGFRPGLIVRMIVGEGVLIGLIGGAIGTGIALAVVHLGRFSLSQEGLSINVSASWAVLGWGLLVSSGVGLLAGLTPAVRAGRREIASCFRAV